MGDFTELGIPCNGDTCKRNIFHTELRTANRPYFGYGWNDIESSSACRTGVWEHVAFVYDTQLGKVIYLNGAQTKHPNG